MYRRLLKSMKPNSRKASSLTHHPPSSPAPRECNGTYYLQKRSTGESTDLNHHLVDKTRRRQGQLTKSSELGGVSPLALSTPCPATPRSPVQEKNQAQEATPRQTTAESSELHRVHQPHKTCGPDKDLPDCSLIPRQAQGTRAKGSPLATGIPIAKTVTWAGR